MAPSQSSGPIFIIEIRAPIFLTGELVPRLYIETTMNKYIVGSLIVAILAIAWAAMSYVRMTNTLGSMTQSKSGFLDYMPDVPRPCPSDYRCGGASREQVRMENRLYTDLRESSKYALPETMTADAYDVPANAAEPVTCMLNRAASAKEALQPEGQYTPWDEIESGFLNRTKKKPMELQSTKTLG